ncbi:MAG: aldo/keto reductase [Bryobacteraceae bacterium]|nr:aldo/keto reductase [Bryobacteraceae bacterium]
MGDYSSSRRNFLAASFTAPAIGLARDSSEAPKVQYRTLGKTGLKVSTLGFGCMLASDPLVVERAVDLGVNYIDTARVYQGGNNERMVGAALKGKRDKVVLVSKAPSKDREELLKELDRSLSELGTDHLDVWFLHNRNTAEEVTPELLDAQQEAKKAGKIRFAGVSFHFNMPEMLDYVVKLGNVDVALVSYNFTMQPEVGEAIRKARAKGMGIVAMKVMAGGYARIQRGDRLYGQTPEGLTARLKRPGAMEAALKWALKNQSVDTAIIGITDFEELEEDIRAMSEPFTEEDAGALARQLDRIGPLYCRMCGACSGVCEKGVRVADTLRLLTYAEGYGQFAMARQQFLEMPEAGRAARCADCDSCSVRCPNGVRVQARLTRAQELLG